MNTYLKQTLLASLLSFGLAGLPSHAQFVDTFSTNTSANYDSFATYLGAGASAQTYAINGSHEFQPNVSGASTTYFIRNTGAYLSDSIFDQSVSLDIEGLGTNAAGGIAFSTSVNSAANAFEFGIITNGSGPSTGKIDSFGLTGGPATAVTLNFSLGPVLVDITRTGTDTFNYSLTGAGLTSGALSGSFTDTAVSGKNLYFGMETYTSAGTNAQIEDNLTYVPEPSVWAMMGAGAALAVLALRFRRATS